MTTSLDDDNPWPGLSAFDEGSQRYFHGRDEEIAALAAKVQASPLVVLFGKSGLGKTSLLKAGLMPQLRRAGLLPVYVRLMLQPGAPAAAAQLADALREVMAAEGVDAPPFDDGESLWAYLHRAGLEFWDARNFQCTPVFVLDQFEEVFTVADHVRAMVTQWRVDFGDLAENRIPAGQQASASLQLREMRYKFLVSLREDFLPELEGWRAAIPSLGKVRMRLLPMSREQALQAVHGSAPHLLDEGLAARIVDFVAAARTEPPSATEPDSAARGNEVEPALLSLFCQGLNAKRRQQGKPRFDDALLEDAKQGILSDYYRSCFEGMPDAVSRFVATELITEKGYRNSVSKDDATPAHLTEEQLSALIQRRLLRVEERYGAQRIELTHDLLTRVVREHRDRLRREDEAAAATARAAQERRAMEDRLEKERQEARLRNALWFRGLSAMLALMLVVAVVVSWVAIRRGERAEAAELAARAQELNAIRTAKLAKERLKRIQESIGMKRAVLSGDGERIAEYLATPWARSHLLFTVATHPTPQLDAQARPVPRYLLVPQRPVEELRKEVAVITYRLGHATSTDPLLETGPERAFVAEYTGPCLSHVVILVEYNDPDRSNELEELDMCKALQER